MYALPVELKCRIFSKLSLADRLNVRAVCRQWDELSRESKSEIWSNFNVLTNVDLIDIAKSGPISEQKMHVLLSYFGAYLNELQFTEKGCGANKITCPYLELLPVILARFGAQIQHIKFSAPDDQLLMGFEAISRFSAPTLKSLSIGSHHPPTDETQKALANILSKCKSLEFLHSAPPINISYLKKNDGRLPNSLKYLKVGEHWKSEESDKAVEFVEHLADNCPNLSSLDCNDLLHISQTATKKLKNVQYIRTCPPCNYGSPFNNTFIHLQSLCSLHFQCCLSSKTLRSLVGNCPNLKHLSWSKGLLDEDAHLLAELPQLISIYSGDLAYSSLGPLIAKGNLEYIQTERVHSRGFAVKFISDAIRYCSRLKYLQVPELLTNDDLQIIHNVFVESGRREKIHLSSRNSSTAIGPARIRFIILFMIIFDFLHSKIDHRFHENERAYVLIQEVNRSFEKFNRT